MTKRIYCPYSDKDIPLEESSNEHIVALSHGGSNQFCLPVQKEINKVLGAKIDGPVANDFFVLTQREKYDARGHSGKIPAPLVKQAKDADSGRLLQVTLGKQLKLWDVLDRKYIPLNGQKINLSMSIDIDFPLQLVAKIALSAGYFVYGELFRQCVRHQDLRIIMKGPHDCSAEEIKSVCTKIFTRFQGDLDKTDKNLFDVQKFMCESIRGSCVILTPGKDCLGIFVGILGHYLGFVNIPAYTVGFPRFGLHDMGHAIFLIDGTMKRMSLRSRFQQLHLVKRLSKDG